MKIEGERLSFAGISVEIRNFIHACAEVPWRLSHDFELISATTDGDHAVSIHAANAWVEARIRLEATDNSELVSGEARFTAKTAVNNFSGFLAFPIAASSRLTFPMSLYNNNPGTPPERCVPRFPATGAASLVLEDTRFPIPGINAERDGEYWSLFIIPDGGLSLGAERNERGETFLLCGSGPVAFNGDHDWAYELKNEAVHHAKGYCELAAGESREWKFFVHRGKTEFVGEGFRDLAATGYQIYAPQPRPVLLPEAVLDLKSRALGDRWAEDGYLHTLPGCIYKVEDYFLYGWTGQSLRLALCDLRLGKRRGNEAMIRRGLHAVEFFVENSATPTPGLRRLVFMLETWTWQDNQGKEPGISSRALGETWTDLARILLFCRENQIAVPDKYFTALEDGLNFMLSHLLPNGVIPLMWYDDGGVAMPDVSAAGSSFLPALELMFELTNNRRWLDEAEKLLKRYWLLGGNDFATPFARATLDARCEDKEAAIPFFVAATELWRLTGRAEYRHMAEATADWLLTWLYHWDVPLRPDSVCARNGFHSVGWSSVSVENQHLDVFFPAFKLYKFGVDTHNERYVKLGETAFAAWSYGISNGGGDWLLSYAGQQSEQYYHTDWTFDLRGKLSGFPDPIRYRMRKYGYTDENFNEQLRRGGVNPWDVAWIIALVLDDTLNFLDFREKI